MSAITNSVLIRLGADYGVAKVSGYNFQAWQGSLSVMLRTANLFSGADGKRLVRKESLIQISDIKLNPVFGARYSTYKEKGIGTVVIENVGRNPMNNIKIETTIEEISDQPTVSKNIPSLQPGEKVEVSIPSLSIRKY